MTTSTTEWLHWAQTPATGSTSSRINPLVIAYLQRYPERLSIVGDEASDLYPTPRAWERVSRNLTQLQQLSSAEQAQLAVDIFSGDLGNEVGTSFAEFVLAQGKELTVTELQNSERGFTAFQTAGEATKVQLLRQWLTDDPASLATDKGAGRFMTLLKMVSPDGQFAVAQAVGDQLTTIIQPMYTAIQQDNQSSVTELYRLLAEIATRGDDLG